MNGKGIYRVLGTRVFRKRVVRDMGIAETRFFLLYFQLRQRMRMPGNVFLFSPFLVGRGPGEKKKRQEL